MVLEYICSDKIMQGKKISVPEGANCFRTKSGKIKFFRANPRIDEGTKEIPVHVNEMSFDYFERHAYNIDYGEPTLYNKEENILKDCNGIRLWASQ